MEWLYLLPINNWRLNSTVFGLFAILLAMALEPQVARAEVSFSKQKIQVGARSITVEIAKSPEQLAHGLMFRESLGSDTGMLFIFPVERELSFWMKNTLIPLSIGFFDSNKRLLEIQDMSPVTSVLQVDIPQYKSSRPAKYALEMNQGWFKKNGVKPGALLKIDHK